MPNLVMAELLFGVESTLVLRDESCTVVSNKFNFLYQCIIEQKTLPSRRTSQKLPQYSEEAADDVEGGGKRAYVCENLRKSPILKVAHLYKKTLGFAEMYRCV